MCIKGCRDDVMVIMIRLYNRKSHARKQKRGVGARCQEKKVKERGRKAKLKGRRLNMKCKQIGSCNLIGQLITYWEVRSFV